MSDVDACRRLSMGNPAKTKLRRSSRQRTQVEEKKENEADFNDEQGAVSDSVLSDDDETVSDASDSGDEVEVPVQRIRIVSTCACERVSE
jgi:hypothetical protein